MKPSNLNLFIVDDDRAVRASLAMLFIARNFRVQTFESGESFLANADIQSHGCLLLDIDMPPGISGLKVFDELIRLGSPLIVIFLSGKLNVRTATVYTKKGAFDCIEKPPIEALLLDTVQRAFEEATNKAIKFEKAQEVRKRWNQLTPREVDVARLTRKGWANSLVADELGIGVRAAETNRLHIYRKLWVSNPTELDHLLRENGIDPSSD
jgi:FixJ family two-component response regulator